MLNPGTFYVILVGKRYLRFPYENGPLGVIVGRQLEHAYHFNDESAAVTNACALRDGWTREKGWNDKPKPITVKRVCIEDVPLPAPPTAAKTRKKR